MFSQASVILSTGGGGVHPLDGHSSGRYASYWTALLLRIFFFSRYLSEFIVVELFVRGNKCLPPVFKADLHW